MIARVYPANSTGMAVVAVTSGANMNFDRLRLVSELADVGALSEAMLATTIPEAPGSFKDFVGTAVGNTDIQVTEFKYRYALLQIFFSVQDLFSCRKFPVADFFSCCKFPVADFLLRIAHYLFVSNAHLFAKRYSAGTEAHVLFSIRIKDAAQLEELVARLDAKQMYTDDISNLEAAQVHLRHLVGGRARSYMGEVPHEHIFQVCVFAHCGCTNPRK